MSIKTNIPQLILTWVSWSWKTTVMRGLLNAYPLLYSRPIQYTTRQPRNENEKDEYVFLTTPQFTRKLVNWDFIEYIEYNKELYAIWKYFDTTKTNIFIAEPVGRAALKKFFNLNDIPFVSVYINVDEEEITRRLESRGSPVHEIDLRLRDFKYFSSSNWDIEVDWTYKQLPVMIDIHKLIRWVSSKT